MKTGIVVLAEVKLLQTTCTIFLLLARIMYTSVVWYRADSDAQVEAYRGCKQALIGAPKDLYKKF